LFVSTLQHPVLPLDASVLQEPVQHLDVCLFYGSLCFPLTCLFYSSRCFPCTCLCVCSTAVCTVPEGVWPAATFLCFKYMYIFVQQQPSGVSAYYDFYGIKLHCKKVPLPFPAPSRMSLTRLFLAGNMFRV